ncbi:hypothetical protein BRC72_11725 [Halobacteriales archaeon QH_7_66_36]|nr:MAG: hypothetical protein BRC72_11725 [Halobacteriales archaeon QH_7_66_36]
MASVILWHINEWVAIGFAWLYLYYVLLQTRIIAVLVVVGVVGGLIVSGFSAEISQYQVFYSIGLLFGASIVAHLVAFVFTSITGL